MRFKKEINSFQEGYDYYISRATQLLKFNYFLNEIKELEYGVSAKFVNEFGREFYSLYIYNDFKGKNKFKDFMVNYNHPTILTSDDCDLELFLRHNNYPHVIVNFINEDYYNLVSDFYGNCRAKRSGVFYMNHIDEGLAILKWLDLDLPITNAAYALHPLVQIDYDLDAFINSKDFDLISNMNMNIIIHMMEYRSVANEYLSTRTIDSLDEIRLSPLFKVNDMLIADKIQNRKDFELYHLGTHPRSSILSDYFDDWLKKLGITENVYQSIKQKLIVNPKIIRLN